MGKEKPPARAPAAFLYRPAARQLLTCGRPAPENWVQVVDNREETLAEFTVRPSPTPAAPAAEAGEVKHFFTSEATSTFRVERQGKVLRGSEVGKNEKPNDQEDASAARTVVNTLVAEGGWAGFQKLQWERLMAYVVHLVEIES